MTLKPSGGNGSALAWFKSSYSTGDGPDVRRGGLAQEQLQRQRRPGMRRGRPWRKSTHSTDDGPECVEVATTSDTVLIRDSKISPTAPASPSPPPPGPASCRTPPGTDGRTQAEGRPEKRRPSSRSTAAQLSYEPADATRAAARSAG